MKSELPAQFRCGILPLHTDTERYRGVTEDERIYEYCELNEVESNLILN